MIYLFESEIPENKSVLFALKYVYGIGSKNAVLICKKLGFANNLKVKHLSKEQISLMLVRIESLNLELASDLKKLKLLAVKKLVSIKSYRGLRLVQGLPIRGQRTHTNARTARKRK